MTPNHIRRLIVLLSLIPVFPLRAQEGKTRQQSCKDCFSQLVDLYKQCGSRSTADRRKIDAALKQFEGKPASFPLRAVGRRLIELAGPACPLIAPNACQPDAVVACLSAALEPFQFSAPPGSAARKLAVEVPPAIDGSVSVDAEALREDLMKAMDAYSKIHGRAVTFDSPDSRWTIKRFWDTGEAKFNSDEEATARLRGDIESDISKRGRITQAEALYSAIAANAGKVTLAAGSLAQIINVDRNLAGGILGLRNLEVEQKDYYRFAGLYIGLQPSSIVSEIGKSGAFINIAFNPFIGAAMSLPHPTQIPRKFVGHMAYQEKYRELLTGLEAAGVIDTKAIIKAQAAAVKDSQARVKSKSDPLAGKSASALTGAAAVQGLGGDTAGRALFDGSRGGGSAPRTPGATPKAGTGKPAGGALISGEAAASDTQALFAHDVADPPVLVVGGNGSAARAGGLHDNPYATDKGLTQPWLQKKLADKTPAERREFERIYGEYNERVVENREKNWGYGKGFDFWTAADYGHGTKLLSPGVLPVEKREGQRRGVCDEWSKDLSEHIGNEHKGWVVGEIPRENAASHWGVAVYPQGKTKRDGVVLDAWENGKPEVYDYEEWNHGTMMGRAAKWYGDSWLGKKLTFD